MESLDKKPREVQEKDVEKADAANEEKVSKSESCNAPASSAEIEEPATKHRKLSRTVGLRRFKQIPIFIVDCHNHVLEFIYRCLASRHLPLENNTLLHFDSHPDMAISRRIPAYLAYDKETMLEELSIENWIMPVCYTGNFNRIIWVKNSWCNQMPVGKYNFRVGQKEEIICVDSCLEYFISEGNCCLTSELREARDLELHVVNADAEKPPNPQLLLSADDSSSYVLDIDLDFFSTANPFLDVYKEANCYMQLKDIFYFDSSVGANYIALTERRKQQLDSLKAIFEHLEEKGTFEGLERPSTDIITQEVFEKIEKLEESLRMHYGDEEIGWEMLYQSGCTTDTIDLPHHISTEDELSLYYRQFKEFLKNLPHPPVLITIACSEEDEYCPSDQVCYIQEKVVEILQDVFGDKIHKKPILYYANHKFDVMKL